MFAPGNCLGRLHGCPFLRGRRALLCEGFVWDATMVFESGALSLSVGVQHHFQEE